MTTFQFTGPDGKNYQVDGPEGSTPEQAFGMLQTHLGPTKVDAPSMASGIGRGIATGVPIIGGLLNKADAATNAALAPVLNPMFSEKDQLKGDFSQRYQQSLKTQEGMDKSFHQEHPNIDTAANIAGGVGAFGAAAGTSLGAQALGLAAKSVPGMMTTGAVSGAGIGAIDAATRGGDASEGAIYGGLAGAAGPAIGAGIGKLAEPWLRAGKAAIAPEGEAARQISQALEKDAGKGLSATELAGAETRGQPVALMDQGGGRATQRLARRASNVSPEAQEAFDNTIFGRFRDQNKRTAEFVQGMSEFGDAHELGKALTESAKRVNRPAYAKAYAAGANGIWSDDLAQMAQAPVVQDAIRKTMVSAKNDAAKMGFAPPKNPFTTDADGRVILGKSASGDQSIPSLQFWDYVKRNLDATGTRDAKDWARILREHLDEHVPEYGKAREGAAQFFGAQDALQAGRDSVTPGTVASRADNRVLRDTLKKLTPGELKLFREGTVDQTAQMLLGKPDSQNILNSINNSPKAKERMLTILGPKKYKSLETYLHVESMMDRFRTAMGNSTTARQLGDMSEGSVIPKTRLSISGMVEDFLTKAGERLGRGIDERVAAKIAQMLTSGDGSEYAKALKTIAGNKSLMNAIRQPAAARGAVSVRGAASGLDGNSQDQKRLAAPQGQ